jgi:hypothetical protein
MNQGEQLAVYRRRYVPPKRRLIKYLHDVTSQKAVFFIVIAMETSNLTNAYKVLHLFFSILATTAIIIADDVKYTHCPLFLNYLLLTYRLITVAVKH